MKNNKEYNIVYASDNNFSSIMGISIVSLFENNKDAVNIRLFILDSNISSKNKKRIGNICKKYNRPLPTWITSINIEDKLNMKVKLDRGSMSQYARLFISSLLPNDIEKVLYLDCDTIVNSSIEELWNIDIKDNIIAALMDAFSKYYRMNIGLEPNDIMFNSGVMLIDLVKWKKENIEEKLMDFICKHNGDIQQGDQGALNAILSKKTYCFSPKFNSVTIFYDFNYDDMLVYRKPPDFYSKEDIRKATENPVIIHFTTSFLSKRPWVVGCEHMYKNRWKEYKAISSWSHMEEQEDRSSKIKRMAMKVYTNLPKYTAIRIAGILQAYVRPFKNYFLKLFRIST